MYIQSPSTPQPIAITKGKVPRVKPAKRDEVPKDYRSQKHETIKEFLFEAILYLVGFTEFIRKGFKK